MSWGDCSVPGEVANGDQQGRFLGAVSRAFLMLLALWPVGCSRPSRPPPKPDSVRGPQSLPPKMARTLRSLRQALRRLSEASTHEQAGLGTAQAQVRRLSRILEAQAEELHGRDSLLASLRSLLRKAAPKSRMLPPRETEALSLLALYRRMDQGGDLELYESLLHLEQAAPLLRLQAGEALAKRNPQAAAGLFLALMSRQAGGRRLWEKSLVNIMESCPQPFVVPFMVRALASARSEQVLIRLAFLARRHPDPRLLKPLRKLARSSPWVFVRVNAAQSLARLVGAPSRSFLLAQQRAPAPALKEADRTILERGLEHALSDLGFLGRGPLAAAWEHLQRGS